jgi:hypothetical protein
MLMEPGKTELDTTRRLTAGALAGLVSVACTYPLDIVRTRLAVQSATLSGVSAAADTKLPGIMTTMSQIYRTEGGVFGLYRGLWPTLLVFVRRIASSHCLFASLIVFLSLIGSGAVRGPQFSVLWSFENAPVAYWSRRSFSCSKACMRSISRLHCSNCYIPTW